MRKFTNRPIYYYIYEIDVHGEPVDQISRGNSGSLPASVRVGSIRYVRLSNSGGTPRLRSQVAATKERMLMSIPRPAATEPIKNHPFVAKLNRSIRLDDDDLMALTELLDRKVVVKKGKDIIVQGYEYKALHIVESGFAIRYKLLHNGKRQIVDIVLPGDIIGFPACFFEYAVFSVMAIGKMNLHYVPLDAFSALCLKRAKIATALIWFAARGAAIYVEHLTGTGRREPLERLAHFLLEMHARLRAVGHASENSFEMPLSQEGIGDTVGLSAPHVNRMLAELKSDQLIAIRGHEIKILDMAALQILAEFRPAYLGRTSIRG
jgi:CRP-like cAMP-binding protein